MEPKIAQMIAISFTNGLMNIFTASMMDCETDDQQTKMMGLVKEGTKCFSNALMLAFPTKILTPDPNVLNNGLNIYKGRKQ